MEKTNPRQEIMQRVSSSVGEAWSAQQVDVMQQTVAKNTNEAELIYFLNTAKTIGLNPFNKEIWCYKDHKGNLIIFTGRDGFLKKAQEHPGFNGMRSCEVREKDEFSADVPAGKVHHNITSLSAEARGPIVGAYAIVFRKDSEPTIEFALSSEYKPKSPSAFSPWSHKESEMIKKCAESKALKKAFGFGMIQSSDDWQVKEDKAIPLNAEVKPQVNPEEVRTLDFINAATTYQQLKQVSPDLLEKYPAVSEAYDKKLDELMGEPIDAEEVKND